MDDCIFCAIGSGAVDGDLVARASDRVFVLPPIRQRPENRGHALVLPVAHVRNLHDAQPDLRNEILAVVTQLTRAFPALYGAAGSYVFQHNVEPDDRPFHLHVHAVPSFPGDNFAEPDPGSPKSPAPSASSRPPCSATCSAARRSNAECATLAASAAITERARK